MAVRIISEERIKESYSNATMNRIRAKQIEEGEVEEVNPLTQELPFDFSTAYTQEELLGKIKEEKTDIKEQENKLELSESIILSPNDKNIIYIKDDKGNARSVSRVTQLRGLIEKYTDFKINSDEVWYLIEYIDSDMMAEALLDILNKFKNISLEDIIEESNNKELTKEILKDIL